MVQNSNRAKTCHQSEKDGAILKQSQNLTTVKKRWCNSQTVPKPANSQKKMVQYSNRTKLSPVRKRWYNTETAPKPANSQKRWYNTQSGPKPVTSQKKMVKDSNRANTCQQAEKRL